MANNRLLNHASIGILGCIGLSVLNSSIKKQAISHNLLRTDQGHFYKWKYGNVFYRKMGNGPKTILFLHDAQICDSGIEFDRLIPWLKNEYTVYVPDLPGCGRSDKPAITYTGYLYAQYITSFIKDVIKQPSHVCAAGFSSSFAVISANIQDNCILSLSLIDPPAPSFFAQVPDRNAFIIRTLTCIPIVGEGLFHLINSYSNIAKKLELRFKTSKHKPNKRMVDTAYESVYAGKGSARFLMASKDGRILHYNINHLFSELSLPVQIIYGEREEKEKQTAQQYKKLNPSVRIVSIKDSGALPHFDNPSEVAASLISGDSIH